MTKLRGEVKSLSSLKGKLKPTGIINVSVVGTGPTYTHPPNHSADMIDETPGRMFMTPEDKEQLSGYVHSELLPSTEWVIYHPLDKYPSVSVVDSGGSVVVGEVHYVSKSIIKIRFSAEFSGKAYLS